MAERKQAPAEGPNGVDRWTSNGYGLTIGGKKVEPPTEETDVEEIEEE
jgi:hypothetical protein